MPSKDLAVREQADVPAVPTVWDSIPTSVCQDALTIRKAVHNYIQTDLMQPPYVQKEQGIDKPFLHQPGGEAIMLGFNLGSDTEILKAEEDWDNGFFNYIVKVYLLNSNGDRIGSATGTANSKESKFGFVWKKREDILSDPRIKHLDLETLKSRKGYGGKTIYQVPNPDIADKQHTIFVMAEKRALLRAISRRFSLHEHYNLDDADPDQYRDEPAPEKPQRRTRSAPTSSEHIDNVRHAWSTACAGLNMSPREMDEAVADMFNDINIAGWDDPDFDGKAINQINKWIADKLPLWVQGGTAPAEQGDMGFDK